MERVLAGCVLSFGRRGQRTRYLQKKGVVTTVRTRTVVVPPTSNGGQDAGAGVAREKTRTFLQNMCHSSLYIVIAPLTKQSQPDRAYHTSGTEHTVNAFLSQNEKSGP